MTFKTVLVKKWTIMLSGRVRGKHVITFHNDQPIHDDDHKTFLKMTSTLPL
jgi:hypothetical protein